MTHPKPRTATFPARVLRAAARGGWARRWWGQLGCPLQRALASTLLGGVWRAPAQPGARPHRLNLRARRGRAALQVAPAGVTVRDEHTTKVHSCRALQFPSHSCNGNCSMSSPETEAIGDWMPCQEDTVRVVVIAKECQCFHRAKQRGGPGLMASRSPDALGRPESARWVTSDGSSGVSGQSSFFCARRTEMHQCNAVQKWALLGAQCQHF